MFFVFKVSSNLLVSGGEGLAFNFQYLCAFEPYQMRVNNFFLAWWMDVLLPSA